MMNQLAVLLRVKELKEEKAFRAVSAKRREVTEALSAIEAAREKERANAATLPAREEAIYRGILGRVVDFDTIDETKNQMQQLDREHAKLVDIVERAVHVHARLEKELAAAVTAHRKTVKDRDKYLTLTDEMRSELRAQAAYREETEIEEMFGLRFVRSV